MIISLNDVGLGALLSGTFRCVKVLSVTLGV